MLDFAVFLLFNVKICLKVIKINKYFNLAVSEEKPAWRHSTPVSHFFDKKRKEITLCAIKNYVALCLFLP